MVASFPWINLVQSQDKSNQKKRGTRKAGRRRGGARRRRGDHLDESTLEKRVPKSVVEKKTDAKRQSSTSS